MVDGSNKKLALVLSGGGARGAYEAGVIHYIRNKLPRAISKKKPFDILCGSSVGAINVCFLAATSHNLEYQGEQIHQLWDQLDQQNIYKRGVGSMSKLFLRTMVGVTRNFFRKKSAAPQRKSNAYHFKGLLDTSPFPKFLNRVVPWQQIALNIQNKNTSAISITATNVHTGKVELFIDKHPSIKYSGRHPAHFGNIEVQHALASAAIPILFPSVKVSRNYYCDGGIRLNTPISPAIQLGADKVLAIGLHHSSEQAEQKEDEAFGIADNPPTMGELVGNVLKSVLLDRLEVDLQQMNRINKIIEWGEQVYGSDFVDKINDHLNDQGAARKDVRARGLKKLEVFSIFPSVDIRKIFHECIETPQLMKKNLTLFERTLLHLLDVDVKSGQDFLSFIFFLPPYLKRMLELGYEDGRANHDRLMEFFGS